MKNSFRFSIKILSLIAFLFSIASIFAETPHTLYISPNNDGVKDELRIPISISDKRYIAEWSLVITDESGNIVRTIGNKEKRPEKMTAKLFFQQLFTPKQGVDVPTSVTWNGILDSGETAPDGKYFYYLTATDDNGNVSKTEPIPVWVDNTPPEINLVQPDEIDKIFGVGAKADFKIVQSGSVEDLWTATINDISGKVVRSFKWTNASPVDISWDGKDDNDVHVADGVYSYSISSTDLAGNVSPEAKISNIIFTAEKPTIAISLVNSKYFSPNGDGIQDTMDFNLAISQPEQKNGYGNKLVSWKATVINKDGKEYMSFGGTDTAPSSISFDGKNLSGSLVPEGDYQVRVTAKYLNGYEPTAVLSPFFTMDITSPNVLCRTSLSIFSPDGDGNMDSLEIAQEASNEKSWKGEIVLTDKDGKSNEKVVKTYSFDGIPVSSFVWNGINDDGALCSDGFYKYRLVSTDLAGNTGAGETLPFEMSTGSTEVILTAQSSNFSPNGDRIQDTITLTPIVKTQSGISNYTLTINNEAGVTVRTISDTRALPDKFVWNGLDDEGARCPDGVYSATLATVSRNGSEAKTTTSSFTIDTVYPSISINTPYLVFSPNADGSKDTVKFSVTSSNEAKWEAVIYDEKGNVVQSNIWQGTVPSFEWDGTDEAGNTAVDGTYSIEIKAEDASGNKGFAKIDGIVLDTRETKAYVTASVAAFSPNGDGVADSQKFTILTTLNEGIESWSFDIIDVNTKKVIRRWTESDQKDVPESIVWDGTALSDSDTGSYKIAEGTFNAKLSISYVKGDKVETSTSQFICTVTPPKLTVRTAPAYFSPDNDGVDDDLFISLKGTSSVQLASWSFEINDPQNGKTFWKTSGKSTITEKIVWDGRGNNGELVQSATDYPYTFTVTDELGMTSKASGFIAVDVLVIRIGDVLKIQVPSIIFRGNNADFKNAAEVAVGPVADRVNKGLEQSVIDNNYRVIKRIAEILNKFKDYKVTIEGHANNVSGTEQEETVDTTMYGRALVTLSQERADYVKKLLVENGVSSNRLSSIGIGGRQPVAGREDKDNWWKNRRVEFILNK